MSGAASGPTRLVQFESRAKRLDPSKPNNNTNFMALLTGGDSSDFKIALRDVEHGFLPVHLMILKTKSVYFSNWKDNARWTVFDSFSDITVMNALEVIYSCSINHMIGCDALEISTLISLLAFLGIKDNSVITALFSLTFNIQQRNSTLQDITPILVALKQLTRQGHITLIGSKTLEKSYQIISSELTNPKFAFKNLGVEGVESFCRLHISSVGCMVYLSLSTLTPPLPQVLNYMALWNSFDPNNRIPHTVKLLNYYKAFISEAVRPYTLRIGQQGALSMVRSQDLQLLPDHIKSDVSQANLSLLESTLLKLDRDALLIGRAHKIQ